MRSLTALALALALGMFGCDDHASHPGEAHDEHAMHGDKEGPHKKGHDDEKGHAKHGDKDGHDADDEEGHAKHGDKDSHDDEKAHAKHGDKDSHDDEKAHAKHGDKDGHDDEKAHAKHGDKDGHDDEKAHAKHGDEDGHDDEKAHAKHGDEKGHDENGHGAEGKDHVDEEGVVHLEPSAIARSGIRVAAAVGGSLSESLDVSAEVRLNPDKVAHISPMVDGQLLSVEVALGDTVTDEQPLAQMRSVGLGQARAELNRTASLLRAARKTVQRQKRLRKEGIASERAYLAAQLAAEQASAEHAAARSRLRVFGVAGGSGPDMQLTSPIAGLIVERHATRGENTSPDDTLFVVADLSQVWVIGHAYEQQISQIALGMPATLTLNAYPGRSWAGTVNFIGAQMEEKTRTLPLRVEIENKDGLLRPGLFGTLRLAKKVSGTTVAVIPLSAAQQLEGRTVVFVPGHDAGEFEAQVVTLGRESRGQVEVIKGLAPGDRYVADGGFVLKSELVRSQLGHGHAH